MRHVADLTSQLHASHASIDTKVQESSRVVNQAVTEVDQAADIMSELSRCSESISTVVETIAGISRQTELLSLNAAIEAARAGEAGLGFAVVASEVRKLAERTREATQHVKADIDRVQGSTKKAVGSINQFGETVRELDNTSQAIATLIDEQRVTTDSIHQNVAEVAERSEVVNESIQQVAQGATDTADSTAHLLDSANELSRQSKTLSEGVEEMLLEIRPDSDDSIA